MREIKCPSCGHINTDEGIKPYPAFNKKWGEFYQLDLWCGGCDALILMKVDEEDITDEVREMEK